MIQKKPQPLRFRCRPRTKEIHGKCYGRLPNFYEEMEATHLLRACTRLELPSMRNFPESVRSCPGMRLSEVIKKAG